MGVGEEKYEERQGKGKACINIKVPPCIPVGRNHRERGGPKKRKVPYSEGKEE